MQDGMIKVATVTPTITVGDTVANTQELVERAQEACQTGAKIVVFPELCLTGYTCGDLFLQPLLLSQAKKGLEEFCKQTKELDAFFVVGLPFACKGKLYNVAAAVHGGRVLGLIPKQQIPNYSEFYEGRHFTTGKGVQEMVEVLGDWDVFLDSEQIFTCQTFPGLSIGIEICEDLWVGDAPSSRLASSGATVICNPSASNALIGKADYRRKLVAVQSGKLACAYLYADAGFGESTQDVMFSGHCIIAENGSILAESTRFQNGITYADVDIGRLVFDRQRMNTFESRCEPIGCTFALQNTACDFAHRAIPQTPFVPQNSADLAERCEEILTMQASALATRLLRTGCKTAVVGLSGGLDSTLALLVTVRAYQMLGRNVGDILAVTMPCFGTTQRTKSNAELLAQCYGVEFITVDILAMVRQHFADIGQGEEDHSVTFENAQARIRTLTLMDLANQRGGLVIGTGDLSELALGWATYNGDHMSMYGVNGSIPKTLVRFLVQYEAEKTGGALGSVLLDIVDTPVSPELLPPKEGEISQKTEELVGPYALHDFFLYYTMRFGYPPAKTLRFAQHAFAGVYDRATILKWMRVFYRRFFSQQFKRSCLPDGVKIGSVSLSPRGDWRMPSDASSSLWMAEVERLENNR